MMTFLFLLVLFAGTIATCIHTGPAKSPHLTGRMAKLLRSITEDFVTPSATKPSSRSRGWMQTTTGQKFYPLEPSFKDVRMKDIAHGLAMTCRYGGHTSQFYSVAEHCVHVSKCVERHAANAGLDAKTIKQWAIEGLLHDSAETYIGDMVRPLKHQPEMTPFRTCEDAIEREVFKAFAIASTPESHAAIKRIDDRILVDEISYFMPNPMMYLQEGLSELSPLGVTFYAWNPATAEAQFMRRWVELLNYPE